MSRYNDFSPRGFFAVGSASAMTMRMMMLTVAMLGSVLMVDAFTLQPPSRLSVSRSSPSIASTTTTTALSAMNRRNKFNKQNDLAAKMAEAKKQREGGDDAAAPDTAESSSSEANKPLSAAQIKERNDKKRFADLLENSLTGGGGGDLDKGYYLTEQQENENADAVFKGIVRLYEGDPAPTSPFANLLDITTGEPLGKGGMKRFVPWEGSRTTSSSDYMVIITDPRPKSLELRTAMKRLMGSMSNDVLKKCLVINVDTPAENRRFVKKNLGEDSANGELKIFVDENKEWMREYTALGEKRFSITMFVLRDGRVEKIAREVEAEVLPMVVKNAIQNLS